jgi:hypothetical protein
VLEPLAQARGDFDELTRLYEKRLELHDDRAERAHWLRKIAEVAGDQIGSPEAHRGAGARAEGRADAGRGAGRSGTDRGRVQAAGGGRAQDRGGAGRADARPGASWRCGAARLYARAAIACAPSGCTGRCWRATRRTSTRCMALEGLYRAAGDEIGLAAILERRAEAELDPQARRARLMEAARCTSASGEAGLADAIAALQKLRADDEATPRRCGAGAPARGGGHVQEHGGGAGGTGAAHRGLRARARALVARRRAAARDAERPGRRGRGVPRGAGRRPTIRSRCRAGAIEERREDWSTLQEVLMRRSSATFGPIRSPCCSSWRATPSRSCPTPIRPSATCARSSTPTRQRLRVPGAGAHAARERALVRPGRDLGKHADTEAKAGRRPTELALRVAIAGRLGEGARLRRQRRRGAGEGAAGRAARTSGALLSLARLHEGAERWDEAAEALEKAAANAAPPRRSPRSSSATRRS